MSDQLTEKVSFDFIRYANCWEDADILIEGLNPEKGSKILSIGSAGDNSFSLLTTNPSLVVAVDINKTQLHLIELKKICLQHLPYIQLLEFLGFRHCEDRIKIFSRIKGELSQDCRLYWERHLLQINAGIVSQGKFEKYFQLFSKKILPLIHSKKVVEELLMEKSTQDQQAFYDRKWNTWRWRLLFKIFFSKYVMGKFGRDPQFLKEVNVSVGDYIFQKSARHLQSAAAQRNFILRYALTGSFGTLLPHYLLPENYENIKSNLHRLQIREGYAEQCLDEFGSFRYMNLSNIFEYMDQGQFEKTANKLLESVEKGGKLAYWNLMVPRRISGINPEKAEYLKESSLRLSKVDKGFFYNQFTIDQVK